MSKEGKFAGAARAPRSAAPTTIDVSSSVDAAADAGWQRSHHQQRPQAVEHGLGRGAPGSASASASGAPASCACAADAIDASAACRGAAATAAERCVTAAESTRVVRVVTDFGLSMASKR